MNTKIYNVTLNMKSLHRGSPDQKDTAMGLVATYHTIIKVYAKLLHTLLVRCTPVPVRINSTYDLHKSSKDFIK